MCREDLVKIPKRYFAVGTTAVIAMVIVAAVGTPASGGSGRAAVVRADQAAAAGAQALVVSRPQILMSSSGEEYTQGSVITAGALSYVPYERTYRGIPVIGGDSSS